MQLFESRRDLMKAMGAGLVLKSLTPVQLQADEPIQSSAMPAESFVDFLEAYGASHEPALVYRNGQDFHTWQRAFRAKVETLRGPLPQRVKPEVEVLDTVTRPDHTRQLLRISVTRFSRLVAYLLIPTDLKRGERRPGIIALHGHTRDGVDTICGVRPSDYNPYALQAVRAGFVVMAPAWWGWAGRDGHVPRAGDRDKCNVIQMAAGMYGLNVLNLHIQDGQAAIDVLCSLPQVDSQRIGCLGNSYGGRTTMWLTVFDERIKACVPAGCMNHFRERSLKLGSCAIQYFHGLLQYGDVQEVFGLVAPRPMQLHGGTGDGLITPADRDLIRSTVQTAYQKLGAGDKLDYVLHDQGHRLVWPLAGPFLRKHLKWNQGEQTCEEHGQDK